MPMKRGTLPIATFAVLALLLGRSPAAAPATKPVGPDRRKVDVPSSAVAPATAPARVATLPVSKHQRVAFVFDTSASMAGREDAYLASATDAIMALRPDQQFGVIAARLLGDRDVSSDEVELVPATDEKKEEAIRYLKKHLTRADPKAKSDLAAGLGVAATLRAQDVWLFSARLNAAELAEAVEFSVGLKVFTSTRFAADAKTAAALRALSERTGGVCVDADGKPVAAALPPAVRRRPTGGL